MSTGRAQPADPARVSELLRELVAALHASGELRSPEWHAAFMRVPRHAFVPRFFLDREHRGHFTPIDGINPAQHAEWLSKVYSNEPLITQIGGDDTAWTTAVETGSTGGVPTSSSTMPGLMALMLEVLGIAGGMRVLEVGTGTGYNAALLCERLGPEWVTSIDVDPLLVNAARERLAALGYAPALVAADGTLGHPAGAPYDRILVTVAVPQIPRAWIEQTREQGRILADIGSGALALLTVRNGAAEGHFLPDCRGFIPIRAENARAALGLLQTADMTNSERRPAALDGHELDDPTFRFLATLRVPAHHVELLPECGSRQFWLLGRDGSSWACQATDDHGRSNVAQHGTHRLWDELEAAHRDWGTLGRPAREMFGLTVRQDGRHVLWCGEAGEHEWELPC